MSSIRLILQRTAISSLASLLVCMTPVSAFAADTASGTAGSTTPADQSAPVSSPVNGANGPTGSASGTYHYNQNTGLWENDYYTFDPSTKVTAPKTPLEYTYDTSSGMWDAQVWQYDAAAGSYHQVQVSVVAPPAGAITHGGPVAAADVLPTATGPSTTNGSDIAAPTAQSGQTQQTAAASDASTAPTSATQPPAGMALTFNNSGTITNTSALSAATGTAQAVANTTVGNVGSGNADAVANYLNLLQSQASLAGANVATFTANIQGDTQGDFIIDPSALQGSSGSVLGSAPLNVNMATSGNIVNNANLASVTGDVTADRNTTVGDVSSGNANTVADIVNMINSVVSANRSFMGVINIDGNYTGNILVPADMLNALLGSSASDPSAAVAAPAQVSTTSTQNIVNAVNLSAASGNVTAADNTTTGNVGSGNALSKLTLLNLTGRQVAAANSMLVFVNVLGSWVGLIMDAPAGTTAAALGGSVTTDNTLPTATVTSTDTNSITNNLTETARSGAVAARQNTEVGNVTSGNATASANIANLINSNFSLSDWFGVLFINVFGTWKGNFGTIKPPVVLPVTSSGSGGVSSQTNGQPHAVPVVAFITHAPGGGGTSVHSSQAPDNLSPLSQANQSPSTTSVEMVRTVAKVLGAQTTKAATATPTPVTVESAANRTWSIVAIALGTTGLLYFNTDKLRSYLRDRHLQK